MFEYFLIFHPQYRSLFKIGFDRLFSELIVYKFSLGCARSYLIILNATSISFDVFFQGKTEKDKIFTKFSNLINVAVNSRELALL